MGKIHLTTLLPQLQCVLSIPIHFNHYGLKNELYLSTNFMSPNHTWPVGIAHNALVFNSATVPPIDFFVSVVEVEVWERSGFE